MFKNKAVSRFAAMAMAAVLLLGMAPITAVAENDIYIDELADDSAISEPIIITDFEDLAYEVIYRNFTPEEYAEESPLLPEALAATDSGGNSANLPVTWICADFDPGLPADYEFSAVLPEGYICAEGVNAPVITIAIVHAAPQPMLFRTAGLVTILQTDSVPEIQAKIQSAIDAADDGERVSVTGSKTNADESLLLAISPNITVEWQAEYSGPVDDTYDMISISGEGTLEIVSGGSVINNGRRGAISHFGGHVIIDGGTVISLDRYAILCSEVEVKGGVLIVMGNSGVIVGCNNFTMSSGFLFTHRNAIAYMIDAQSSYINTNSGDNGIIAAWDKAAVSGPLIEGSSAWLLKLQESASVVWANESGQSGIRYTNGSNTGFIPISGITVEAASTTPTIVKSLVSRNLDNALVKFTSNKGGSYYYQLNGSLPTAASLIAAGANETSMAEGTEQIINLASLAEGAHTLYIAAEDSLGGESNLLIINIPAHENSSDTNINVNELTQDIPVGTYANWSYDYTMNRVDVYNNITVRGSKANVNETLYLNISSGSYKVIWQADYSGSTAAGISMLYAASAGTLEIAPGGSVINTGGGIAVYSNYAFITVNGGEVRADEGFAIYAGGNSMGFPVTINGGTVSSGTGTAIYVKSNGGSDNDKATITGGFVFSLGTDIEGSGNVIDSDDIFINPISGDNGVVVAWDKDTYPGPFSAGSTEGLITRPAGTAMWGKSGTDGGISYANGENAGFYKVDGVSVTSDSGSLYIASLYVNKDNRAYMSHGKAFTLKLSQNESTTYPMSGANGILTAVVPNGIWNVYDGALYTGTDIAINDESGAGTLNYYTVSYSVNDEGTAAGSIINTNYDGSAISSGDVVLGGKALIITATGAGTASYTYLWSGQGTSGQTSNSITVNSLSSAINAVCTITGYPQTYSVTVSSAGAGASGSGTYAQGATVTINAGMPPANMRFKNWTAAPSVIFANSSNAATTFSMPSGAVAITAHFEAIPPSVTAVTINPAAVTVQKGTSYQFGAAVSGDNSPGQGVTWSVSGNNDAGTAISGGLLNVAAGETVTAITVTAVSDIDGTKSGSAAVTLSNAPQPVPTVTSVTIVPPSITLNTGDTYIFGALVYGTGNPSQGVVWTLSGGAAGTGISPSGKLTVASGETATALTVKATSALDMGKSGLALVSIAQPIQPSIYTVNFNANGGFVSPLSAQTGSGGKLPALPVPVKSGYSFSGWFTAPSAGAQISINTVFTANATLYAQWSYIGSDNTSEDSSYSDNENPSYSRPSTGVITEKQPDMTELAKISVRGTVKDKILSSAITKKMAESAFNALEITNGGIAVSFDVKGNGDYTGCSATFERAALEFLRAAGVKHVKIGTEAIDISFDAKSIEGILAQTSGNISISAVRLDNAKMSAPAQKAIGSRPMFNITIKDSSGKNVSELKGGAASVSIAYKPSSTEKTENLQAVYIKQNGQIQWISPSSYDNGRLIFSRNSFSVYGVGYKMPAPVFSDTKEHWAKEHIDFVTGAGLISGITAAEFSPDEAVTRETFLTALGKLSNADVAGYSKSSFADIKDTNPSMPYIEWAADNNIVHGIGSHLFAPDNPITREQMALMLDNYAKAMSYSMPISHSAANFADDANISIWAKAAVEAIQSSGIISGKPGYLFDPQGSLTRAEASVILRKFTELVAKEETARAWVQNNAGQWQYIEADGKAKTGWLTLADGSRYWFDDEGIMASGKWADISGKQYYLHPDGKLAVNTLVDGYEVDSDGVRKEK